MQTKQHCTASSSSLYLCIHGKELFLPSKNCHCLRSFAVKDREWEASRGGGRPHANDANANLQANQNVVVFFFPSWWGRTLLYTVLTYLRPERTTVMIALCMMMMMMMWAESPHGALTTLPNERAQFMLTRGFH